MQVTVTAAAMPTVRKATVRHAGSSTSSLKLAKSQVWTISLVKSSTLQSAETSSATSAAM